MGDQESEPDEREADVLLEEEEEEEDDQETDELLDIADGVHADLLLGALVKRNVRLQEILMENDISIEEEVLRAKTKTGYTALHLAAAEGLNMFATFLLQRSFYLDDTDSYGNTALHWAVTHSDNWALVDSLLLHNASVDAKNQQGRTPLHLACILGRVGCARSLLLHGACMEEQDDYGHHALTLALLNKQVSVVQLLFTALTQEEPELTQRVVTAEDHRGRTPLHALAATCVENEPSSTLHVDEELLQSLVQAGADINARDHKGLSPLLWALASHNERFFYALVEQGADLQIRDEAQRTILHYVAFFDMDQVMDYLYQQPTPPPINEVDRDGCTALHAAAGRGARVKRLVALGADVFASDLAQLTPLHYALMQGSEQNFLEMVSDPTGEFTPTGSQLSLLDGTGRTLLHYCAAQNFENLFFRLREAGVNENKKDRNGHTLIHYAANFGSLPVIEAIFADLHKHRRSSYITSANCASQKPLHIAAAHANAKTCHFFLENRASSWAPDRYGCMALHYAARYANLEALNVLMNPKDINKTDKAGATALHYAALSGNTQVVDALLEGGAKLRAKDLQGRTALFYSFDEGMMLYFQQLGLDRKDVDKQNRSILFTALQLHRRELFRVLHISYKMDLAERDKSKASLLHHAAYCGDLWFIQYLLENTKLTPSTVDGRDRTVLYYAAAAGRSEAVRILLARIQKPDVREKLIDLRDRQGRSALDAAAFGKHVDCVLELTSHMDSSKNYMPAGDGRTPLHVVVNNPLDSPSTILWDALLCFFDINAKDRHGRTCLHRAVFQRLPRTTSLLLEKGADPNIQDKKGLTVLMIATYHDSADIIELLHVAHSNETLKDRKGRTARDFEEKRKREEDSGDYYDDDDEEPITPR